MSVSVVLLCVDGPYQRYLAKLLDKRFNLKGIVVRYRINKDRSLATRVSRYVRDPADLYRYLAARSRLPAYLKRAQQTHDRWFKSELGHPPRFPGPCEMIRVPDVNRPEVGGFIQRHGPDVVCVNGTNLIREPLLSAAQRTRYGLVNLHSGLSPYTRGGNCNLFALNDGRPEWVGMTVHHIDPGIDSGDIILSARPPLYESDNYEDVEMRCFGMGIRMMAEAVDKLLTGKAERAKQWSDGKLYLARTGYRYSPWRRLQVNRALERGMIADYLAQKQERDKDVRVVGDFTCVDV